MGDPAHDPAQLALEADLFGRGRTTAGITLVCMLMLVLARANGAGAYGIGGVPFLIGLFVASGVVAGRAVGALVGRVWRAGAWLLGVPVALATCVVSGATWDSTPSDSPLLVRLFTVTTAASVAWALTSSRRTRGAACVTAAVAVSFLVFTIAADL